jgi:hypothetical protein
MLGFDIISMRLDAASRWISSPLGSIMPPRPGVVYDFNPNNLPDDLLRAVGLMVAATSQTESVVQDLIGAVLGADQVEVLALTAQMPALLKDHIARALIELNATTAETVDTVDDLLDAINVATARRNVIVHNSFARNPETGEIFSIREKARGSLQVDFAPVNAEEITKDANAIYEAGMNLMRFMLVQRLAPVKRTRPLRMPLDRARKARQKRKNLNAGDAR